jgi:hypothetical protein
MLLNWTWTQQHCTLQSSTQPDHTASQSQLDFRQRPPRDPTVRHQRKPIATIPTTMTKLRGVARRKVVRLRSAPAVELMERACVTPPIPLTTAVETVSNTDAIRKLDHRTYGTFPPPLSLSLWISACMALIMQ